jgi:hypothetical protein
MGRKPFPREDTLRFIVQKISEGASDAEIQEGLLEFGPSGRVPRGQHGVFGEVGIRTIHNIRQVYEVTGELISAQAKQQNFTFVNANVKHLEQVQAIIQKWNESLITRHRSADTYVLPPHYNVEQDKLFPYALAHCPSVNDNYQVLLSKSGEYQKQSNELNTSQLEQWKQVFAEMEDKLRDSLEMSLLSQEYIRHRCDLCPTASR